MSVSSGQQMYIMESKSCNHKWDPDPMAQPVMASGTLTIKGLGNRTAALCKHTLSLSAT